MLQMNRLGVLILAALVALTPIASMAQITYQVQIEYPEVNTVVNDVDFPVKGSVKRSGIGPSTPGSPFMLVTATVDGVEKTTYTDKDGRYEFRFEPDPGVYDVQVEVLGGQFSTAISGIQYVVRVGGVYDSRELYYDIDRQNLLKSHMEQYAPHLKFTMARLTIPDATFNWTGAMPGGARQFPIANAATFPWIGGGYPYSAARDNNADNPLNDQYFIRLLKFCESFNNSGIKVVLTVFDPNYFKNHGEATAIANNPWSKLAHAHGLPFDHVLHTMPGAGNEVSEAMEEFLIKLATTLYDVGPDVYIEFNNETRHQTGTGEPEPSNTWLKNWQDFFYTYLRDHGGSAHSDVSYHLMVNAQTGKVDGNDNDDYTGECWCHYDDPDDLGIIGIRNRYISGHYLGDYPENPIYTGFHVCQFTPLICPEDNVRMGFFTEGGIGAGGSGGEDEYVYNSLINGYYVALGANQEYRNLVGWGSGANTAAECNEVNEGVAYAVWHAIQELS